MERTGPRIYVPLSLPDHASAQPTYAVLEFVGFSSPAPPASTPHLLHPSSALPSPPPAMLCLPPAPSSAVPPSFFPLSVTPPIHPLISTPHNALMSAPSQFPISHFPDPNTFYLPSPPHLLAQHPRTTLPSSRLDIVNLDSPPSSPSSLAPSSASSVSRDSSKDKHPHSSTHVANPMGATSVISPTGLNKPMVNFSSSPSDAASSMACGSSRPMVPLHSSPDGALSKSMVNFNSAECGAASGLSKPMVSFNSAGEGGDVTPTQISVSQTDRETIVHTHSSNFRDVVRQLTGASSDDQDLLPVTLPARLANRVNNTNIVQNGNINTEIAVPAGTGQGLGTCVGGGASTGTIKDQLGLRKAPLKLHERRKSSMKNLEKLTTAFNHHAVTELSPLNPSPVTPLASDFERFCNASTPTSQGSSGLSSPINLISKGRSSLEGSSERRGAGEHQQEHGCFYMQRPPPGSARPLPPPGPPEKASPTLLSLFPESPACSPRDR